MKKNEVRVLMMHTFRIEKRISNEKILQKTHEVYLLRLFLQRLFKYTTTQKRSRHSTDTVSEFYAEAPQATASEGLAQGPYVAARVGFEPATLRTKGVKSTNTPLCPKLCV